MIAKLPKHSAFFLRRGGLAHGWELLRPVAAGQPLRWSDIAFDANVPAVKLRREMEQTLGEQLRSAA